MQIKATQDFLLVEVLLKQEEHRTPAGVWIPKNSDVNSVMFGKVIDAGPGKMLASGTMHAMEHAIGDIVVFEPTCPKTLMEFATVKDGDGHQLPKQYMIRRDFIIGTATIEPGDLPVAASDARNLQLASE